ncbi:MAG: FlgB family protein [Gemmobacter sp.]
MFQKVEIIQMAHALAAHAGARQAVIARNVAHADTPGYRAADLPGFAESWRAAGGLRATRAGHLNGGATLTLAARPVAGQPAPNGNSVSLEAEMMRAAEVRHQHDLALSIYRSASNVMRASLGRGR